MGISLSIDADLKNQDLQFSLTKKHLQVYQSEADNVDSLFNLNNRQLERIALEQPGWLQYYGIMFAELKSGCDVIESLIDERKSVVWQNLTEKHSRDLSQTDKNNYVLLDEHIQLLRKIYLAVNEMKEIYEAIVEAFKSQGYALNGYMRFKVSGAENADI